MTAQLSQALVRFKPAKQEGDAERKRGGFLRGRKGEVKGEMNIPQDLHSFSTGYPQLFHRSVLQRQGLTRARVPCIRHMKENN